MKSSLVVGEADTHVTRLLERQDDRALISVVGVRPELQTCGPATTARAGSTTPFGSHRRDSLPLGM